MKAIIYLCSLLCIASISAQNNAIFGGGKDDGYHSTGTSSPTQNTIFAGGSDDGSTAATTSSPSHNGIFNGGSDDGSAAQTASTQTHNPIFGGGQDDGSATEVASTQTHNSIFGGGMDDGYAAEAASTQTHNSIFGGGPDDGYAYFYLETAIVGGGALPIELLEFSAIPQDQKVHLFWKTTNEVDHDYFVIERSRDLSSSLNIHQEVGKGGQGQLTTYQAIDTQPLSGRSYYRLRSIDIQGQSTYSHWIEVFFDLKQNIQIAVYPNPTSNLLNLRIAYTGSVNVELYDLNGKSLLSQGFSINNGVSEVQLSLENFPSGIYVLKVTGLEGDGVATLKVQKW